MTDVFRAVTSTKTKRRVISIDLSAWELGDWPRDILNHISVEKQYGKIEINIDEEVFQPLIRKIIQEAIEAYIEEASFSFKEDGLHIQEQGEYKTECIVPWDSVGFADQAALEKIHLWIKERISDYGWDEDEEESK